MSFVQIFQLLLIAAFWGGSHVLVRASAPVLGPYVIAWGRVFVASVFLFFYLNAKKLSFDFIKNYKAFLVMGFLYAAFPFLMFSLASIYLPASYLVILNATNPVFTALFMSLFFGESFTLKKGCGISLGVLGVVLIEQFGSIPVFNQQAALSLIAGLSASASYAMGGIYVKRKLTHLPPEVLTGGGNMVAVLFLLPLFLMHLPSLGLVLSEEQRSAWLCVIALGVFSSGIAFVMFYKLIRELGAFRSSLVTFLMPVFGMIWGVLFLHETVNSGMILGASVIIFATSLFVLF